MAVMEISVFTRFLFTLREQCLLSLIVPTMVSDGIDPDINYICLLPICGQQISLERFFFVCVNELMLVGKRSMSSVAHTQLQVCLK